MLFTFFFKLSDSFFSRVHFFQRKDETFFHGHSFFIYSIGLTKKCCRCERRNNRKEEIKNVVLLKIFWDDMLPIILLNYLHSFKFFLYKVSSICWKAENLPSSQWESNSRPNVPPRELPQRPWVLNYL